MSAYLLVRLLASQYKHPIILNYKSQLNAIRYCLGYTDSLFRKTLNLAVLLNLASIEGNNLRLLSNTQDRKDFKRSKRNDYRRVANPTKFKNLVLLQHNKYSQDIIASKKDQPSLEEGKNSDRVNQLLRPYNNNVASNVNFASARSIQKALGLSSTSQAHKILKEFAEEGLITLTKNTQKISKGVFKALLEKNCKNIRYNKEEKFYYVVYASTFELNYTLKRTKPTTWQKMSEQDRHTASDMGWTKEVINLRSY